MSETDLVNACLQYLSYRPWLYWRNNSGALPTAKGGFIRFGAVGSPDIFILREGNLIGVECKVGRNKQSPVQKNWEKIMERNGGRYWLIYDIETFISKLV